MNSDLRSDLTKVYEALKAEVVNYRFRPGEQIRIAELADHLRVSSTPVREALIRLEAEGLLDVAPRRGFFAKTLDLNEMIDFVKYRFFLLKSAVEVADFGVTEGCLAPLAPDEPTRAVVPMSEGDHAPRVHVGQAIWFETIMTRVASLSQNRAVVHAIRNVNDRMHYVRSIDLERSDVIVATQHSIERLWRSLQRADIAEAVAVLEHDRDGQIERLPTVIKEGLSRACTPTALFAPVVPLSPPRIWTGAAAASRPLACALMTARR